jgi:TonB family protein
LRGIETAVLASIVAIGCHPRPAIRTVTEPELRGESAVRVLPRDVPADPPSQHGDVCAAYALPENPLPQYPPEALRAKVGDAWVVVRVVVSEDGTIREVRDSPVMRSSGGPYAASFRSAVEQALTRWRFDPAVRRAFEDGPDADGDGKPDFQRLVAQVTISMYFDLRFDFSIVEGRPQVVVK